MIDQEILDEIKKLTNNERLEIIEAVLEMIRKELQHTEHAQEVSKNKQKLEQAAEKLLADYMSDDELTAFKSLDSEDFHA